MGMRMRDGDEGLALKWDPGQVCEFVCVDVSVCVSVCMCVSVCSYMYVCVCVMDDINECKASDCACIFICFMFPRISCNQILLK